MSSTNFTSSSFQAEGFSYQLTAIAGKGASTTAYFADRVPVGGGKTVKKIVKVSEESFENQAKYLNMLSPGSKESKHVDHFDGVYWVGGKSVAVCEPSDADLNHVEFTSLERPGAAGAKWTQDYLTGLGSFHRQDIINRDVKGRNLIVSNKGAKITDFGLCREASEEEHRTAVTLSHAAPFIWNDFNAQIERRGQQSKEADIFAFGRLIQLDLLNPLIRQYSKEHDLGISLWKLKPQQSSEDSWESVREVHEKYGNRAITGPLSDDVYPSFVFYDRDEVFAESIKAINRLTILPASEQKKLRALARLARELQAPTRKAVCAELHLTLREGLQKDLLIQKVTHRLGLIRRGMADGRTVRAGLDFSDQWQKKGRQVLKREDELELEDQRLEAEWRVRGRKDRKRKEEPEIDDENLPPTQIVENLSNKRPRTTL